MMQYGTLVQFQVKDVPVQFVQDVYLMLKEDEKVTQYKMQKNNELFAYNILIKPQTQYKYKYRIYDQNQLIKQEEGLRNLNYQRQIEDQWNLKVVKLKIQTTQQEIMKTLQINVNSKNQQDNIINKHTLQLKKVMYNNKACYEQTIFVDTAIYSLDILFVFNAVKYDTNRNEQQYTKKKTYQYPSLKTVGNQSILEIQEEEFDQLSRKPQCKTLSSLSKSFLEKFPNLELSNEKVQNLVQIYETSLRYFRENLEIKNQQINQLKLEKLEQEGIIFFNYQDVFQQDSIGNYQSEFFQVVEDYKEQQKSFVNQLSDHLEEKKSSLKNYKEKISNQVKTIEHLYEKVKQLKTKNGEDKQKIEKLEQEIDKFNKLLKNQKSSIDELEKELSNANQQNQIITQEKDKFKQQVKDLDVEIQEQKRIKERLLQQNEQIVKEKKQICNDYQNLQYEKKSIIDQLIFKTTQNENQQQHYRKQITFQKFRQNDMKDAKQFLRKYHTSSEDLVNLIKESRNILIKLIFQHLKDIKDVINFHKESEIKDDTENIKNQLSQIELKLKNFVEEKTTLSQVEEHFQSQVLKQLQCLCDSNRIKQNERKQLNDTQNCLNLIIEVLKKFDNIIEKMPTLQPNQKLLMRQPTEAFNLSTISPNVLRLQRMGTHR